MVDCIIPIFIKSKMEEDAERLRNSGTWKQYHLMTRCHDDHYQIMDIWEYIFTADIFVKSCHLRRCSSWIYENIFAQRSSWAKGSRPRDHKVGASPLVVSISWFSDHLLLVDTIRANCHHHFHCTSTIIITDSLYLVQIVKREKLLSPRTWFN